jgi:hypothetical protein
MVSPPHRRWTSDDVRLFDGSPRICELVEYYLEDIAVKGAWTGPGALSLMPHALAPVAELPVLEIVSAPHHGPLARLFEDPATGHFWNPATDGGRAALNAVITRQAQISAYIDDFKPLMTATLVVTPLLIAFEQASDGGPLPITAIEAKSQQEQAITALPASYHEW